jgi:hypothetical protein
VSADKANDGDSTTRRALASSCADGQWWRVDLGSVRQVDTVSLNWEAAYASSYYIQVSYPGLFRRLDLYRRGKRVEHSDGLRPRARDDASHSVRHLLPGRISLRAGGYAYHARNRHAAVATVKGRPLSTSHSGRSRCNPGIPGCRPKRRLENGRLRAARV